MGLAIIDALAENDFLRTRSTLSRWIAANDRGAEAVPAGNSCNLGDREGRWHWADPNLATGGDSFRPLCMNGNAPGTCAVSSGSFQSWASGEPSNSGCSCAPFISCSEGEDCGALAADGTWNDVVCSNALGYICETP